LNEDSKKPKFKQINDQRFKEIELENLDDKVNEDNRFKQYELDNIDVEELDNKSLDKNNFNRFKKMRDDENMDEEEVNEIKLCGDRCRRIPGNIRAKFIETMFADYVRLQTTVSATWNVLSKYNKQGYIGKLECIEVEKDISLVEAEIIKVENQISKITVDINKCRAEEYEMKIRRTMWLYWIYKIENFAERERVMLFRKK